MPGHRSKARKHGAAPARGPLFKSQASSRSREVVAVGAREKAVGEWFAKLVALQSRLRAPNGCPWDREQTHASLRKFLVEETYEVLDAMESQDPRKFASELGDLLLQIVFHSVLAEETGRFTISDVIEGVYTKMVRRHPHVFGNVEAKTSAAVLKNWEQIKAEERAEERVTKGAKSRAGKTASEESVLSGVPRSLPAVLEAYQLTRRASHVGFDWDNLAGIFEKLDEEAREIESSLAAGTAAKAGSGPVAKMPSAHLEEEVGDLLFSGVNVARFLGVDPEIALKKANHKFAKRFRSMEAAAAREGRRFAEVSRARMEELWNESKARH
jgi:MazG family protein